MNSAILLIKNKNENDLAKVKLFDKHVVDYTINQLKRLDIDTIYLVGDIDFEVNGVVKRNDIFEAITELKDEDGKCLLVSPFYPLVNKEEYGILLGMEENVVFVDDDEEIIPIYAIYNKELLVLNKLSYKGIKLDNDKAKRFVNTKDIAYFQTYIKNIINAKWANKGVIITDPSTTIIGEDVTIDKNTTIYPNTVIEGKTVIGQDNVIGANSILNNVVIGNKNVIKNSNIADTTIHNNVTVDYNCNFEDGTEIFDNVKVGSLVKLKNSKIGRGSYVDQLTYLGDADVDENVNIGSGVVTVNYDGRSRHTTIVKAHSVIGSNVSLVAPVTIGEYVVVAAGSTIDQDVKDGDMAIARFYQQNKKGYGYKYTKED